MPSLYDFLNQGGGPDYQNQANNLVNQAQGLGYFNPAGSAFINEQVRSNALRTARNSQQRGSVLAKILGLSPQQAQGQFFNIQRQNAGDISNAINNAHFQQLMGNQEYARSLFGNLLGNQQQLALLKYQQKLARENQPGFGSQLGQLIGRGITGYFTGGAT